ncbi:MAG: LysR family transcriptional regulator [Pseudomonadota bacterium]
MNLRSLSVFAGVMDRGTLTESAAGLHLSQSAASRLLSLLEEEIGTRLFRREKRNLIPTEAAEALYPEALRILAQINALPEVASGAKASSPLRIICHSRLAGGLVVPAMTRLLQAIPDQSIRLETAPRRELARRVQAGRYDFAIAALPLNIGTFVPETLAQVRLGLVLPVTDPRSERSSLSLSDIADLDYIALDETTAVRRTLDTALDQAGPTRSPVHEVSTGTNAYRMVAAGLGFTFADPIALDPEILNQVALVPWDQDVRLDIGYFRLGHDGNAAADTFQAALRTIVEPFVRHADI